MSRKMPAFRDDQHRILMTAIRLLWAPRRWDEHYKPDYVLRPGDYVYAGSTHPSPYLLGRLMPHSGRYDFRVREVGTNNTCDWTNAEAQPFTFHHGTILEHWFFEGNLFKFAQNVHKRSDYTHRVYDVRFFSESQPNRIWTGNLGQDEGKPDFCEIKIRRVWSDFEKSGYTLRIPYVPRASAPAVLAAMKDAGFLDDSRFVSKECAE